MLAVYLRVSSSRQTTASQRADLERWVASQSAAEVCWYEDQASGLEMSRPAFDRLMAGVRRGEVSKIVVWRLDRLGRSASGLLTLCRELEQHKVALISLREGLDMSTPAGRLMLAVLAGLAQYETEVRGERVRAGLAAAKARGKKLGGGKPGRRWKRTAGRLAALPRLLASGMSQSEAARVLGLSRSTVWRFCNRKEGSCQQTTTK